MDNKLVKNNISVSILNAENIAEFLKNLKDISTKNNLEDIALHFDIMDGKFVDSFGVDIESIKIAKRLGFFVDVHLMVENPTSYITKLLELGADSITVHYEIENLTEVLTRLNFLKKQKKIQNVGLAIKPKTKITNIHEYLYLVDMLLVMSVEPGKGMQKYIKEVEPKIKALKDLGKIVQVDGGINNETIVSAREAGATSFVVGSYITKASDIENKVNEIYKLRSK